MSRLFIYSLYLPSVTKFWHNSDKILTKFWHAILDGFDRATFREFPVSGAPREQGVISTNCGWRMHGKGSPRKKGQTSCKPRSNKRVALSASSASRRRALDAQTKKNLDCDVAVDSGHRSCSLGDVWQRTRVVEFRIGRKRGSFFTLRRKMLFCACAKDSLITATGRSSMFGFSPCSNVLCYRFAKEHWHSSTPPWWRFVLNEILDYM